MLGAGTLTLALLSTTPCTASAKAATAQRPNIVLILADDLGIADLGAFGGEIPTPNLDALAARGVRMTNFHSAPACSPTRAMLLSGADHHLTGLGSFGEILAPNQKNKPGYEGYLTDKASSIAERLQTAGYFTVMTGKWHLGGVPHDPAHRGFDRSFALINGGGNHFGGLLGADGLRHPKEVYLDNGRRVTVLPADFYSSDYFTDRMIEFLDESPASGQPFFAYLAFSAPHYPLQAPSDEIARQRGRYDAGWDKLRADRLKRMKTLGLHWGGTAHSPVPMDGNWKSLTPSQRSVAARTMEVYAAMITRLDRNVGRLVSAVKRSGRYDNTIFLFLSDNGAEGNELDKSENQAAMGRAMLASGDNRRDVIGTDRSFVWVGSGWGQASSAPFWLYKHFPTEGGIRVPLIVVGPGIKGRGVMLSGLASVLDLAPTFSRWAGIPVMPNADKLPYEGASLVDYLAGSHAEPHDDRSVMGWELWGRRAIRRGRWKAVNIPPAAGTGRWMLFDMETDPGEIRDLASMHPDILRHLEDDWARYARRTGVVMPEKPGL